MILVLSFVPLQMSSTTDCPLLYTCIHVYTYVYIYAFLYNTYTYTHTHTHTNTNTHTYTHTHTHTHMYMYTSEAYNGDDETKECFTGMGV